MTRRTFGSVVVGLLVTMGLRAKAQGLTCPRCHRRQYVVCGNRECECYKRAAREGGLPQRWTDDGEACICPYCGFTEHADGWFERELALLAPRSPEEAR